MMRLRLERYHRRLVLQGGKKPLERLILLVLLPISLLYGAIGWVRGQGYQLGLFRSYRAPVKVVSVGNIAVGGTGKTPVVDWLVKSLLAEGKRPAVVSRGFGGTFAGGVGVVSDGVALLMSPAEAGDEPCLLARRNPGVPIVIAPKRAAGVQAVIEKFAVDIVILDDGFQHRAVQRDIDLVLIDGRLPLGNGLPLPAGLLREFPGALRRADLLLMTRADPASVAPVTIPTWKSRHRLADFALDLQGRRVPLADLADKPALAFAGIAEPDSFFDGLTDAGLTVEKKLPFGDHQRYDALAIKRIHDATGQLEILLTTEKDAVKLASQMFAVPCYQVPMDIGIVDENEFKAELFRRLWRT